jgi:hypothetical protein
MGLVAWIVEALTPGVGVESYANARRYGYQHACSPPRRAEFHDTWRCECGCPWICSLSGGGPKRRSHVVSGSNPPWESRPIESVWWEHEPATGPLKWFFDANTWVEDERRRTGEQ